MKFYREKDNNNNNNNWFKIVDNKLTAIYLNYWAARFYKNGERHNIKNAAYIRFDGFEIFCLNGKVYDIEKTLTKESWCKFVKLQVFK